MATIHRTRVHMEGGQANGYCLDAPVDGDETFVTKDVDPDYNNEYRCFASETEAHEWHSHYCNGLDWLTSNVTDRYRRTDRVNKEGRPVFEYVSSEITKFDARKVRYYHTDKLSDFFHGRAAFDFSQLPKDARIGMINQLGQPYPAPIRRQFVVRSETYATVPWGQEISDFGPIPIRTIVQEAADSWQDRPPLS